MSNTQTTIQNNDAIRTGSAKVEISSNGTSWIDLGAMNKIGFKNLGKTIEVKFDNVPSITKVSEGNKFSINFELCEINWENIAILKDGVVTATVNAGVDTTVHFASGGKLVGKYVRLINTRSDGKKQTIRMENATMTSNIEFNFLADDDNNVASIPVTLEGYVTEIVDEQVA